MIALLLLSLFSAFEPTARAAGCDETCMAVRRILADRASGFASLKGPQVGGDAQNAWTTKMKLLDLECRISNNSPPFPNTFGCFGSFSKEEARKRRDDLLAAFRTGRPDWIWFSARGSDGAWLRGGPSSVELIAWIELEGFPNTPGGPVTSLTVGINVESVELGEQPADPYPS